MSETVLITSDLNNNGGTPGVEERIDWSDLYNSFKVNFQLNTSYEISFTATYTDQYKDAFNMLKMKRYIYYHGQFYTIQQLENGFDENGLPTMQVTANALLIDMMKNIRIDPKQPTEDNPDTSGNSSSDSGDSGDPQPGVVIKRTDEQQTYSLQNRLDQFFNNNDQGIKYELHGNFPNVAVDCTGSLYEWIGQNLSLFGAYYVPDNYVLKIYDIDSLAHPTDKQFRYLNNVTSINFQSDGNDMYNDFDVYGGKMEKDITTAGSGGTGNGVTEPVNGNWEPVMQNAASLVGENLSANDIANINNRIRIESSGREDVVNNWDPNAAAGHPSKGLLQFIDSTFNYYCRPPYTDIMKGLDQLIAMMNIPNWRQQISGSGGWSPHGAPISKATIQAQSSSAWGWPFPSVGEGSFTSGQLFGVQPGGGFRTNGFHDGLDFGSIDHPGSEVHAIHGGTVTTAATWGGSEIKWYLVITDETGLNVEYQEAFSSASNIIVGYGQKIQCGQVIGYRTTNHLHVGITRMNVQQAFSHAFLNDGTWLDPQAMIKNGGDGQTSGSSDTTSTTTQTYYSLYYHYHNADSVKKYGLHRGPQVIVDSIYDMDALKKYVDKSVHSDPPTTVTNNEYGETDFKLGDTCQVVIPENHFNRKMVLMGIEYNPFNPDSEASLTWNNTGLVMKDSIYAMYQDINSMNRNVEQIDYYGATGTQHENHFANINVNRGTSIRFSHDQLAAIQKFTNG